MGSHQDSPEEIESKKRHSVQELFKCLVNLIHNGTNTLLIDLTKLLVVTRNIYIKNFPWNLELELIVKLVFIPCPGQHQ